MQGTIAWPGLLQGAIVSRLRSERCKCKTQDLPQSMPHGNIVFRRLGKRRGIKGFGNVWLQAVRGGGEDKRVLTLWALAVA